MSIITNLDRKKFQDSVLKKAVKCLENGQRVRIPHHRYQHTHELIKIEIGYRWRLVSLNGGESFELMTHEKYSAKFFWS